MTLLNKLITSEIKSIRPLFEMINDSQLRDHIYLNSDFSELIRQKSIVLTTHLPPIHFIFASYLLSQDKECSIEVIEQSGIVPSNENNTNFLLLTQGDIFEFTPSVDSLILFSTDCGNFLSNFFNEKHSKFIIERVFKNGTIEVINQSEYNNVNFLGNCIRRENDTTYFFFKVTFFSPDLTFTKKTNVLLVNTDRLDTLQANEVYVDIVNNILLDSITELTTYSGLINTKSIALTGIVTSQKTYETQLPQLMAEASIRILNSDDNIIERIVLSDLNPNTFGRIYKENYAKNIEFL